MEKKESRIEINHIQNETPGKVALCLYLCLPQCSVYWPSLINPYNTALLRSKLEAENIPIL